MTPAPGFERERVALPPTMTAGSSAARWPWMVGPQPNISRAAQAEEKVGVAGSPPDGRGLGAL